MIEARHVIKCFDDIKAVDDISATIREGSVFGLVGTNGAGKSTFLRILCGVLKPDSGEITIDGQPVYENEKVKEKLFYISDDAYFFSNTTPAEMMEFYQAIYSRFDKNRFLELLERFELPAKRKINTFSKGMKKQLSILLGLCANTEYIFCDETFDGLDPVMRQAVKSLFAGEIAQRQLTPIIASHNLRELEDICDHVGLLHKGGILLSKELDDMKLNIHKIQLVPRKPEDKDQLNELEVLHLDQRGSLLTVTARGTLEDIEDRIAAMNPLFYEILPLSLEEIFISETEVVGYDIKKLIF